MNKENEKNTNEALNQNTEKDVKTSNNLTASSPLKKTITILTCFLVTLEILLNYVFSLSLDTKIIVEVASIVLSALVFIGVLKTNKNNKDFIKTKEEIEKSITKTIDKLKKK